MEFLKVISETKRLMATLNKSDSIVFYVEDASHWKHFDPIIKKLSQISSIKIVLITSDRSDPKLNCDVYRDTVFYVGVGMCRTIVFVNLKCKVCVLTMPDLGYSFIKKSKFGVHYVYVHHSIVSTHAQYREKAFDHFDTIFCVGDHHKNEHRRSESVLNTAKKVLLPHGYCHLESLRTTTQQHSFKNFETKETLNILIAPSWGKNCIIERHGDKVVLPLLLAGHNVVVRPHIETQKRSRKKILSLIALSSKMKKFKVDLDNSSKNIFSWADIMISDWSGVAFEFAFLTSKSVLFIDVPQKINNPNYTKLAMEPVEVSSRAILGSVLNENKLHTISEACLALYNESPQKVNGIKNLFEELVHPGAENGERGAQYLQDIFGIQT